VTVASWANSNREARMNGLTFLAALIGVGIALLLIRISALERRLNRLARLDAKVDALLKHAGITFDEFQNVPAGVREALERGQRIEAIKRYREATGTDLKSAKEAVDEIRRRGLRAS
jgi:ribosomal protein L7/L12